ncbi:MAG: 3-deoxy-manno-octulosonate cytidylyltransferase [Verrucomicrobiota bacterium]
MLKGVSIPKAIIVPARLQSIRFPRKLLHPVQGEPLILHTARQVKAVAPETPVFFAIAEEELKSVLESEGYSCVMTDPDLASGTDRIAYANREILADQVVNVQADEPLVSGRQIAELFSLLDSSAGMSTLAVRLTDPARINDPSQVKVVMDQQGRALYFSRAPIPWDRESKGYPTKERLETIKVFGHLGLYGYQGRFLERFVDLKPSPLERIERLEQLRVLENGIEIKVGVTEESTIGVDTPEDLVRLERALDARST